jgi:integrase
MKPRPPVKHRGALKLGEVGEMLRPLDDAPLRDATRSAILLLMYTGLRDFALRGARWKEIDFEAKLWEIPAERMKGRVGRRKAHVVPLPRQAIKVLRELAVDPKPDDFIFAGQRRNKCIAENTITVALRSLGFPGVTAHGCRSLLTDFCYEAGFRSEAVESQMSHQLGTISRERQEAIGQLDPQVRGSYLRSPFLELRTTMMAHWADTMDALKAGKPVPRVRVDNVRRIRAA